MQYSLKPREGTEPIIYEPMHQALEEILDNLSASSSSLRNQQLTLCEVRKYAGSRAYLAHSL